MDSYIQFQTQVLQLRSTLPIDMNISNVEYFRKDTGDEFSHRTVVCHFTSESTDSSIILALSSNITKTSDLEMEVTCTCYRDSNVEPWIISLEAINELEAQDEVDLFLYWTTLGRTTDDSVLEHLISKVVAYLVG